NTLGLDMAVDESIAPRGVANTSREANRGLLWFGLAAIAAIACVAGWMLMHGASDRAEPAEMRSIVPAEAAAAPTRAAPAAAELEPAGEKPPAEEPKAAVAEPERGAASKSASKPRGHGRLAGRDPLDSAAARLLKSATSNDAEREGSPAKTSGEAKPDEAAPQRAEEQKGEAKPPATPAGDAPGGDAPKNEAPKSEPPADEKPPEP